MEFMPKRIASMSCWSVFIWVSLRVTYNANLFLLGVPVQTSPRHVHVPTQNANYLAAMQEGMIEPIDEAIEALGRGREP